MTDPTISSQDFARKSTLAGYNLGAVVASSSTAVDRPVSPSMKLDGVNSEGKQVKADGNGSNGNGYGTNGVDVEGASRGAAAELGRVLGMDAAKGVPVHAFNPDASTAEKAAIGAENMSSVVPLSSAFNGLQPSPLAADFSARAVALDTTIAGEMPAPTITVEDVDKASREEGQGKGGEVVPKKEATGITAPDSAPVESSIVGWIQAAGGFPSNTTISDASKAEGRTITPNIFTEKIPPEFYGKAYHNAGIIIFAVLATRAITLLKLSWGWIIIVVAFCMSMYSISIERTRTRARDDIQRELMKTKLVSETESADWINSLLDRAWLIAEPLLSATVIAMVDDILKTAVFGPVESMKLTTFTLGNKAPRIDSVRTFPNTPDDEVIMEWALSFTPNDLDDLTPKQARNKVNPKMVLSIRLGKGFVSGAIPVLLEDISFKGQLRLKIKLISNYPHVQVVHMSFMTKPEFDYVLKPLGGDKFGMDINSIPGLAGFIKEQVHANLGPMMYEPNIFTINLEQLLSGTPLDSAIGILKVHVDSARGLKATKIGGSAPDPYVSIGIGIKPAIVKTKTITSTQNPTWNDTQFVLVNTLADTLKLSIFDYNEHRPDSLLGVIDHELAGLAQDAEQDGLVSKVLHDGKDRGEIHYSLSYYPVLVPTKLADGSLEPVPDSITGIVRLTLHQGKDFDLTKVSGALSSHAKVSLGNGPSIFRTPTIKASNAPAWEASTQFLVPDKNASVITIKVMEDKELARDPEIGRFVLRLADLLDLRERKQDWFPFSNGRPGKLRLSVEWKPLAIPGGIGGAAVYVPPIGIMRIWLKKAVDVKNVESKMGGKSDPYVKVTLNNKVMARTDVVNNNLNPEWDSIVYVPVHRVGERLLLEVMDYQNLTKDRSLGTVDLKVSDFARKSDDNPLEPYVSTGSLDREDPIKQDRGHGTKGTLFYTASFSPAVALEGGIGFPPVGTDLDAALDEVMGKNGRRSSYSSIRSRRSFTRGHRGRQSIDDASMLSYQSAVTATPSVPVSPARTGSPVTMTDMDDEVKQPGIKMTDAELLGHQSGILAIQIVAGRLSKKGRLEVLVDEGYWPAFATERWRSTHQPVDQVGEVFIRELDFSRITLRLNENDDGEKEEIFAECKCDTRELLETSMSHPATFTLESPTGSGEHRSTILLSARYLPVDIALEMRETINNMGFLKVELLDGKEIRGVDRSGKSDPFVQIELDGKRVFKSEVQKKTLSPVWNEKFEVMIPSRVAAQFIIEAFDWNQASLPCIEADKSLGIAAIDLSTLEPFEVSDVEVPLNTAKHGQRGVIRLRLLFRPEIIIKSRKSTSTFSAAGRTMSMVGAAPIAVGKGVGKGVFAGGKGVVHGVGFGVGFAGRRIGLIKKKDKHGNEVLVDGDMLPDSMPTPIPEEPRSPDPATSPHSQAMPSIDSRIVSQSSAKDPSIYGDGKVQVNITCLRGKEIGGGDVKPYVSLQVGKKTHKTDHAKKSAEPEWNENFRFSDVSADGATLYVKLMDHKTLGKDKELGDAQINLLDYLNPDKPEMPIETWVPLSNDAGHIQVRLELVNSSKNKTPSIISKTTPASPASKFSIKSSKNN